MQPQPITIGPAQIRHTEVYPRLLSRSQQQHTEPGQRHLRIGSTHLQRHDIVEGHTPRWSSRRGRRPRQVRTQVRGLDGDDSLTVPSGVLRDTPQRMEPTDTCFQLVTTELINSRTKPVGNITFLSSTQAGLTHTQLPPGGVRAEQHDHATHSLQKCRTHVVHCLEPILRSHTLPSQVIIHHHTRQHDEHRTQDRQPHTPGGQGRDRTMPGQPVAPWPATALRLPHLHEHGTLGAAHKTIKSYGLGCTAWSGDAPLRSDVQPWRSAPLTQGECTEVRM